MIRIAAAVQDDSEQIRSLDNFEASFERTLFRLPFSRNEQGSVSQASPDCCISQGKQWRRIHDDPVEQGSKAYQAASKAVRTALAPAYSVAGHQPA